MSDAQIIPFPVRRRQAWAHNQLARAGRLGTRGREWLVTQVDQYGEHLSQLGIEEGLVNREMDDLAVMLGLLPSLDKTAKAS